MLLEEFLKPLEISQSAFASQTGVSFLRLYEVCNAQRNVTPDMALRLAEVTSVSASFWLEGAAGSGFVARAPVDAILVLTRASA